jgi:DNA (cytosine-5)-methyltransferase 1
MEFNYVEGFCGPGGMSLGLKEAHLKPLLAFDYDGPTVATYQKNLGSHGHQIDARALDVKALRKLAGLKKNDELFLFAGGPPCQGFSKQKRGAHLGDERNDLVLDYLRFVAALQPCYFFFENVAIFGQKRGLEFVEEFKVRLGNYRIQSAFLNAANFGLPQTRERFVMVGVRNDIPDDYSIPQSTVGRWKTIKEAIGNLPSPPLDYTTHPKYFNHQRARVTQANIDRFSHVPQGGGWQDIPKKLRLPCHQRVDVSSGGWPDVYGRLSWDGQCPTITGGFDSFTRGRYGHPSEDRPLTPREAARIQGFPDWFEFVGNRGDVRKQIGNAVPPPLAKAIGDSILAHYQRARKAA